MPNYLPPNLGDLLQRVIPFDPNQPPPAYTPEALPAPPLSREDWQKAMEEGGGVGRPDIPLSPLGFRPAPGGPSGSSPPGYYFPYLPGGYPSPPGGPTPSPQAAPQPVTPPQPATAPTGGGGQTPAHKGGGIFGHLSDFFGTITGAKYADRVRSERYEHMGNLAMMQAWARGEIGDKDGRYYANEEYKLLHDKDHKRAFLQTPAGKLLTQQTPQAPLPGQGGSAGTGVPMAPPQMPGSPAPGGQPPGAGWTPQPAQPRKPGDETDPQPGPGFTYGPVRNNWLGPNPNGTHLGWIGPGVGNFPAGRPGEDVRSSIQFQTQTPPGAGTNFSPMSEAQRQSLLGPSAPAPAPQPVAPLPPPPGAAQGQGSGMTPTSPPSAGFGGPAFAMPGTPDVPHIPGGPFIERTPQESYQAGLRSAANAYGQAVGGIPLAQLQFQTAMQRLQAMGIDTSKLDPTQLTAYAKTLEIPRIPYEKLEPGQMAVQQTPQGPVIIYGPPKPVTTAPGARTDFTGLPGGAQPGVPYGPGNPLPSPPTTGGAGGVSGGGIASGASAPVLGQPGSQISTPPLIDKARAGLISAAEQTALKHNLPFDREKAKFDPLGQLPVDKQAEAEGLAAEQERDPGVRAQLLELRAERELRAGQQFEFNKQFRQFQEGIERERLNTQSYNTHLNQLTKLAKPVEDAVATMGRINDLLNDNTPQSDALIGPMVVKATIAGGPIRITQPEINQFLGGQTKWNELRGKINEWRDAFNKDPHATVKITDEQRRQIRNIVGIMQQKVNAKNAAIEEYRDVLSSSQKPDEHRSGLAALTKKLTAIDRGSLPEPPKAGNISVTAGDGTVHQFASEKDAQAFEALVKKAGGATHR